MKPVDQLAKRCFVAPNKPPVYILVGQSLPRCSRPISSMNCRSREKSTHLSSVTGQGWSALTKPCRIGAWSPFGILQPDESLRPIIALHSALLAHFAGKPARAILIGRRSTAKLRPLAKAREKKQ